MEQEAKLIVNESKDDQKVFVWGQGDFELGTGANDEALYQPKMYSSSYSLTQSLGVNDSQIQRPFEIQMLRNKSVLNLASGPNMTMAITEVFVWGLGRENQLGINPVGEETLQLNRPTLIPSLKGSLLVKLAACGSQHCMVATEDNVYSWGSNSYGQLGLDVPRKENTEKKENSNVKGRQTEIKHRAAIPEPIPFFKDKTVLSISCGDSHSVAVTDEGIYSWGQNSWGQLGFGDRSGRRYPTEIPFFQKLKETSGVTVSQVSCGAGHTIALTSDGKVYGWGLCAYGQLGLGEGEGNESYQMAPQPIVLLKDKKIVQVSCGSDFTLFRDEKGKVYATGYNSNGQCGQGNTTEQLSPMIIEFDPASTIISHVVAGPTHCAAIGEGGQLFTWGKGINSQLGTGQNKDVSKPVLVISLKGYKVASVSCGSTFTVAAVHTGGQNYSEYSFREALFSKNFSDIHLKLKDESGSYSTIHAHRVILWCRSKSLLKDITLKGIRGTGKDLDDYTVDWMSLNCAKKILEYIYTDTFGVPPEKWPKPLLQEVIEAASKYQGLQNIVKKCNAVGCVSTLSEDMKRAVNDEHFKDITIISQDGKIPAHQVLLSARSPFFKAMLSSHMKETKLHEISLNEKPNSLLLLLIEFLYTEKLNELPVDLALDLLETSDQFSVLGKLTRLCENVLRTAIDSTNICDVLQFANLHQATTLKKVCIQYILKNFQSLEAKLHEELPAELLQEVLDTNQAEYAASEEGLQKKFFEDRNKELEEERQEILKKPAEETGYSLMAKLMKDSQAKNKMPSEK